MTSSPAFSPAPPRSRRGRLLPVAALALAAAAASAGAERVPVLVAERGTAAVLPDPASERTVALPLAVGERASAVAGGADRWYVAGLRAEESGERIVVFAGGGAETRRLPALREAPSRFLGSPLPVAAADRLAGVAWIEGGERAQAVRFAAWDGEVWGAAETVSPPGPGSQLAPAAAVLDDGTPLLVWSAFDGADDEILWSARTAEGWSEPRRLAEDDRVPDVTPAVAAVPGGALAAWSRYDEGEYRLWTAAFRDGRWEPARRAGEPGSLFPTFVAGGERPRILYRTADPAGWAVLELDGAGRALRWAGAAGRAPERPVVVYEGVETLLAWPGTGRSGVPLVWREVP